MAKKQAPRKRKASEKRPKPRPVKKTNRKPKRRRRPLTKQQRKQLKWRRRWRKIKQHTKELMLATILALVIFSTIFLYFFRFETVTSYNMNPTLNVGDRLVVRKTKEVKRFDLVVLQQEGEEPIISRIVGLPREHLAYQNDQLLIDDRNVLERFITEEIVTARREGLLYTEDFELETEMPVPENAYFVLGDNRSFAQDSRRFGFVEEAEILGVVTFRVFPIHAMAFY